MTKPDLYEVLVHYGWQPPMPGPGWRSIRCDVHDDRHASARINYDTEKVHCFACGFRGDVYDVIQHHEGVDYRAAVNIGKGFTDSNVSDVPNVSSGFSSRAVSGGARDQSRGRGYVPPWLRSKSGTGR